MSFLQFHFSFTPSYSAIGICAWNWTLKPLYLSFIWDRGEQELGSKGPWGGSKELAGRKPGSRTDLLAGYLVSSILGCLHWSCNNRQLICARISVSSPLALAQSKKQAPPPSQFYWGGTSIPKWVAFPQPYVIQVTDPSSVSRQSSTSDLTDPPSAH